MFDKLKNKMECIFGFIGVIVAGGLVITAAFLTPGYNPIENTVSSLGIGNAKSLFSIGFVIGGSLGIPFYIYLERNILKDINEIIRRIATGVSIIVCVCIALVGIIPDETYPKLFVIFHGVVAFIAFIGSVAYIALFSFLMLKDPRSYFQRYHPYLGFLIVAMLIALYISLLKPLIEWILTILILLWILLTALHLIFNQKNSDV